MSLIIDAIKRAQQLRMKDLKGTPFFRDTDAKSEKRWKDQGRFRTLAVIGLSVALIFLVTFAYSRWKPHETRTMISAENNTAQHVSKECSQELPMGRTSPSRTESPSLWEKYEPEETGRDVLKKTKPINEKKTAEISRESRHDRKQNWVASPNELLLKPSDSERRAGAGSQKIPATQPPEPPEPKPATVLPKQEASAAPTKGQVESGKNETPASDALTHFNSGVHYSHQRDYTRAIGAYQKAISLDPGYAEAYNNLGIIYQEVGDLERALSAYQKAIEINPAYEKALNNLGVLLYLQERYDEAIQAFQQAITYNANNIESHVNLGIVFKKQGKVDQAIESYHRALAINPVHGEAHYNAGLLYEQLGKIKMAIDHYQMFVQIASTTYPELVAKVRRHLNYLVRSQENKKQ